MNQDPPNPAADLQTPDAQALDTRTLDARSLRALARSGQFTGPTAGHARGTPQFNLVALPQRDAADFLLFAQRNPVTVPVVEVLDAGQIESRLAPGSDVRTDLPRYRVYRHGVFTEELTDARSLWQPDFVTVLIGCSFTFEAALEEAGIEVRHLQEGRNVPMYRTSLQTAPAGRFGGPVVMSMRPLREQDVARATEITARFPRSHGTPLHVGTPGMIGISDLDHPDYGDAVTVHPGEIPVFWGCGVTPQAALERAGIELAVTHAPGHMFVGDPAAGLSQ